MEGGGHLGDGRQKQQTGEGGACTLAEEGNTVGITSKTRDVFLLITSSLSCPQMSFYMLLAGKIKISYELVSSSAKVK